MTDRIPTVLVDPVAAAVLGLLLFAVGLAVAVGLWWWRRRPKGASEVCWIHYNRFPPGGCCRVCGLGGGYTGVNSMVAVLDNGRGPGPWKLLTFRQAEGGLEGTYESEAAPEAWDDKGVLRVDWLSYGKPLAFDRLEIVRATDAQVESFVQQVRFQSEESVRRRLIRMDCVLGGESGLSENTLRVLGATFARVVREDELGKAVCHPATQRRFPLFPASPMRLMVWIPPGRFTMGSPEEEEGRWEDEGPQTEVTISRGYGLGKYEVTQREWEAVMEKNPSRFEGADLPVEMVSWDEAMEYCRELTKRERSAGRLPSGWDYTLPTEAQWEYACRAGTTTRYSIGDSEADLEKHAWYVGNSGKRTHPVGQKRPNGWDLHDMHGNVWEWCLDWWANRLPGGSVTDPKGPGSGSNRVIRGGSWIREARRCRSALRNGDIPSYKCSYLGFRVALVPVP